MYSIGLAQIDLLQLKPSGEHHNAAISNRALQLRWLLNHWPREMKLGSDNEE